MKSASQLDPRSKLVLVLCLSTVAVFIQDVFYLSCAALLAVVLSLIFGSNLAAILKKMKKILWLFFAIAFIQSIFSPAGDILLKVGSAALITSGGLIKGVLLVLRMLVIIVSATILTTSTSREIIQSLVQIKIPYEVAFMVSVGIRFLPILTEEIKNSITAIQLRGIELDKVPIRKRIKLYSFLIMPIVTGAVIKSRDLSIAMETRAFRAFPQRTSYLVLNIRYYDYLVIAAGLAAAVFTFLYYYQLI